MNTLITVIGNVGSGKSTAIELLAKKMSATVVPADEFYTVSPFLPLELEDRPRWSLTGDLWFLMERVKLAQTIPALLEKTNVLVDSGVIMNLVYAHSRLSLGYVTEAEWQLYKEVHEALCALLTPSDKVVYLTASTEVLLKRIAIRGREFEKSYTAEYLETLESSLKTVTEEYLGSQTQVITFDTGKHDIVQDKKAGDQLLQVIL